MATSGFYIMVSLVTFHSGNWKHWEIGSTGYDTVRSRSDETQLSRHLMSGLGKSPINGNTLIWNLDMLVNLSREQSITLPPTNMATDRGSLQKEMNLPGTSPQVPC